MPDILSAKFKTFLFGETLNLLMCVSIEEIENGILLEHILKWRKEEEIHRFVEYDKNTLFSSMSILCEKPCIEF